MAEEKPFDPFAQWREWFDRSERQLNAAFNELMATDSFKASQGRAMEAFVEFQRGLGERTQALMSAANVVTRADIERIGDRLERIDQRLHAIESRLGIPDRDAPSAARARPRRTRQPPSAAGENDQSRA